VRCTAMSKAMMEQHCLFFPRHRVCNGRKERKTEGTRPSRRMQCSVDFLSGAVMTQPPPTVREGDLKDRARWKVEVEEETEENFWRKCENYSARKVAHFCQPQSKWLRRRLRVALKRTALASTLFLRQLLLTPRSHAGALHRPPSQTAPQSTVASPLTSSVLLFLPFYAP
jgi:hypothetical protein